MPPVDVNHLECLVSEEFLTSSALKMSSKCNDDCTLLLLPLVILMFSGKVHPRLLFVGGDIVTRRVQRDGSRTVFSVEVFLRIPLTEEDFVALSAEKAVSSV